jgi:hypothetical protein
VGQALLDTPQQARTGNSRRKTLTTNTPDRLRAFSPASKTQTTVWHDPESACRNSGGGACERLELKISGKIQLYWKK